jgi:hypothetical protein
MQRYEIIFVQGDFAFGERYALYVFGRFLSPLRYLYCWWKKRHKLFIYDVLSFSARCKKRNNLFNKRLYTTMFAHNKATELPCPTGV